MVWRWNLCTAVAARNAVTFATGRNNLAPAARGTRPGERKQRPDNNLPEQQHCVSPSFLKRESWVSGGAPKQPPTLSLHGGCQFVGTKGPSGRGFKARCETVNCLKTAGCVRFRLALGHRGRQTQDFIGIVRRRDWRGTCYFKRRRALRKGVIRQCCRALPLLTAAPGHHGRLPEPVDALDSNSRSNGDNTDKRMHARWSVEPGQRR